MPDDSNTGSQSGLGGVAIKAIDKLTDDFMIVVVVGLVVAAILLSAGAVQGSTVAIVIGALLVFAILVLGAVVYLRGRAATTPLSQGPREFTQAVGRANEFASWCDLEIRPFPHAVEERNDDARYYFGERMAKLSEDLGRLRAVADRGVAALGDRVLKDFERVDPRRDNVTAVERDIAFEQLRADVDAFTTAYSP